MSVIATSSSQIYNALKGLLCLHKPSGILLTDFLSQAHDKILKELNDSNPEYQERLKNMKKIQSQRGLIDYSSHPLVLGDGYDQEDLYFNAVNDLDEFTSGLSLVSINCDETFEKIKSSVFLRQYMLDIEFGKATSNSFSSGRLKEKSSFEHLVGKPQILEKNLAKIRSSHQRDAFKQCGVGLKSKEAYDLAVKGLVKPQEEHEGFTLLYGLEVVNYKLPKVALKVTCVNETPRYLAEFAAELGLLLKSNAVLNGLRLVRYGPFNAENSLLANQINLQNVIDNIHKNSEKLSTIPSNSSNFEE